MSFLEADLTGASVRATLFLDNPDLVGIEDL